MSGATTIRPCTAARNQAGAQIIVGLMIAAFGISTFHVAGIVIGATLGFGFAAGGLRGLRASVTIDDSSVTIANMWSGREVDTGEVVEVLVDSRASGYWQWGLLSHVPPFDGFWSVALRLSDGRTIRPEALRRRSEAAAASERDLVAGALALP